MCNHGETENLFRIETSCRQPRTTSCIPVDTWWVFTLLWQAELPETEVLRVPVLVQVQALAAATRVLVLWR